MATANRSRTANSGLKKKSGFKFHWWMALILVGIVAVVGIAILRFSKAGTAKPLYYSTFTGAGVVPANNNIYKLDAGLPAVKLTNSPTNRSATGDNCRSSTNSKGELVYVGSPLNSNSSSIWVNSNSKNTQLTKTTGVTDYHPEWSGDGSRIYFIRVYPDIGGVGTLMVMNPDGTNLRKLSATGLDAVSTFDVNPLINELVVQNSPSLDVFENLLVDPSGNVLTKISTNNSNGLVCFANNGGSIVFQNGSNISIAMLNTMKNGPAKVSNLATEIVLQAGFSPDNSSVLGRKNRTNASGQLQSTSTKIDVATKQQIEFTNIADRQIIWNPNLANNLIYLGAAPNATSPTDRVNTSIYSINADGTNKKVITTTPNISIITY